MVNVVSAILIVGNAHVNPIKGGCLWFPKMTGMMRKSLFHDGDDGEKLISRRGQAHCMMVKRSLMVGKSPFFAKLMLKGVKANMHLARNLKIE